MDSRMMTIVSRAASRLAELGNWPGWIDPQESLVKFIPQHGSMALGFNATIACALNQIPIKKQRLSARMHARCTDECKKQILAEIKLPDEQFADSETCWFLAASFIGETILVDEKGFELQICEFLRLKHDPKTRVKAARGKIERMCRLHKIHDEA